MKLSVPQVKTPSILLTLQSFLTPFETLEQLAEQYGEIFQTQVAGLPPTTMVKTPKAMLKAMMDRNAPFAAG